MRKLHKLTAVGVARTKKSGLLGDGGGLYLQVTKTLSKSWLFRYMRQGRPRAMGLGPLHVVTLAEARLKAHDCRRQLYEGIDPIEAKRKLQQGKQKSSMRFRDCADKYIAAHRDSWKNEKHVAQWENTLSTYAHPIIGDRLVSDIDTDDLIHILGPIWTMKTETATRLRGRLESILSWATVRKLRSGPNPARWKGHLDQLLAKPTRVKKVKHHAALPFKDAPDVMKLLQNQQGTAAIALRLTILTASRTNEIIAATKDEFDLGAKVWTVPAERMKAGREHRVSLCTQAIDIITPLLEGDCKFLFPGKSNKHLSNMAMLQLLKRMKPTKHSGITVHGFRSTFKDWARETTDYAKEVSEAALAHIVGDKTEAAYARGDRC